MVQRRSSTVNCWDCRSANLGTTLGTGGRAVAGEAGLEGRGGGKLLSPERRRCAVEHAREEYRLSERHAHAQDVCQTFKAAGIRTSAVWGDMAREDRRATLARFSRGDVRVVTNCTVLTEGFDEPRVDTIIMARPTQSRLLYAQMVGRGTRCHPEKTNLMVIDISDNSKIHRLPGLSDLFSLPPGLDLKGSDVLETEQLIEELTERCPCLSDHLKSGQRLSLQNRPMEDAGTQVFYPITAC